MPQETVNATTKVVTTPLGRNENRTRDRANAVQQPEKNLESPFGVQLGLASSPRSVLRMRVKTVGHGRSHRRWRRPAGPGDGIWQVSVVTADQSEVGSTLPQRPAPSVFAHTLGHQNSTISMDSPSSDCNPELHLFNTTRRISPVEVEGFGPFSPGRSHPSPT